MKITGVGRMAIASVVPDDFEANINQHIVAIRTTDKRTSETLAAYLNLDIAERLASRRSTGGTRPALDYPTLLSLPIIYDDRIVTLMELAVARYEKKLTEAERLLATIDVMLLLELHVPRQPEPPNTLEDRIFRSSCRHATGQRWDPLFYQGDIYWFVRGGSCSLVRLGILAEYFQTGFAAGRNDQGDADEGVIQIRPTNISDDRELVFRRNVYISPAELPCRNADLLQRGEVLFNNTNSQELVGKSVYFDVEGDFFSSNHITRIGVISDELDPQYLTYVLNLYQRRRVFFKLCTNWNNQSGVGADILRTLPIPLPTSKRGKDCLAKQVEIVAKLDDIRNQARQFRRQASNDLEKAKKEIEALILGKGSTA